MPDDQVAQAQPLDTRFEQPQPQLGTDQRAHVDLADAAARYGYSPIETPMFEDAAVFERAIGAVTDVVEKELFRIAAIGADGSTEARWALLTGPGLAGSLALWALLGAATALVLTPTGLLLRRSAQAASQSTRRYASTARWGRSRSRSTRHTWCPSRSRESCC